jgi:DNA-binding transcriptional LysR family regulator
MHKDATLNLGQVEPFHAVMQHGSMTAAAQELHTSLLRIWRLIAHHAIDLDCILFENRHEVVLTSERHTFLREV